MLFVDVIQDPEAVVRAKANLPLGRERRRLAQWLAVLRFDTWVESQLFLGLRADQAIELSVDRRQMFRHPARVNEGIRLTRHDGHNFGHSSSARQADTRSRRVQ